MDDLITAIDLGTSKICTIIAELDENGMIQILGVGNSPCDGIKKGVVVDIEATTMAIEYSLEQAENMADVEVSSAYISIPGGYTKLVRNKGIIAVSGENKEIDYDDVKRVLNSAAIVSMPQDQQIIDIIPFQYIIDGYDEIKDPLGMVGVRLEADVDIITASATTITNLIKSVNGAGIDVLGIVPEPYAASESILTRDERELGVLVIDMGAGTCDISLFKNEQLIYSSLIPIAGNHITNDISVGLRISFNDSEEIKKDYGIAYTPLASEKNLIKVSPIGIDEKIDITELQLSEIIEARIAEIFDLINTDIIKKELKEEILAGIVLTGGGVGYLDGAKELAGTVFNLPVRIGCPLNVGIREPIYTTSIGLINYPLKRKFNYFIEYNDDNIKRRTKKSKKGTNKGIFSFIKRIWEDYF